VPGSSSTLRMHQLDANIPIRIYSISRTSARASCSMLGSPPHARTVMLIFNGKSWESDEVGWMAKSDID
jgi:hypothetical protein